MRRYGWHGREWESEAYKHAGVKPGDIVEAFGYQVSNGYRPYRVLSLSDPEVEVGLIRDEATIWVKEQYSDGNEGYAEPCDYRVIKKVS